MMRRCLLLLLLFALPVLASDMRPFLSGSRAAIERAQAGKPYILAFWSVDCAYCAEELQQLDTLTRSRPEISLMLVSIDGLEMQPQATAFLKKVLPETRAQRWIFAEEDTEHLQFSVDRRWHGELPRSYFHDAAGQVRATSGRLDPQWLAQWARSAANRP